MALNTKAQIGIWASELASAIGKKRFKPREKTIARVWQRSDDTSFVFSICLDHAGEALRICKGFIKDESLKNILPNETESERGRQLFTYSLKEILLGAEWSDLRRMLSEFVDSKTFGEAKQNDLLSVLDEDERVKEATGSLCNDEKKSVDETVDKVWV